MKMENDIEETRESKEGGGHAEIRSVFKIEKRKKDEETNSFDNNNMRNSTNPINAINGTNTNYSSGHDLNNAQNLENLKLETNSAEDERFRIRNNSFHSEFILFRRTLQLKRILRKTRIDSLLKKCKSKVFRTVQEAINLLTGLSNSKDNRLPQSFITNINIEYNKRYLNRTVEDIYHDSEVFNSIQDLINQNPNMSDEDKTYLVLLLKMTHKDAFESYIKSQRYKSDYNYIKQREGEKYAILFDYVAKIYVRYFLNGRGNKKRNPRKNRKDRGDPIMPHHFNNHFINGFVNNNHFDNNNNIVDNNNNFVNNLVGNFAAENLNNNFAESTQNSNKIFNQNTNQNINQNINQNTNTQNTYTQNTYTQNTYTQNINQNTHPYNNNPTHNTTKPAYKNSNRFAILNDDSFSNNDLIIQTEDIERRMKMKNFKIKKKIVFKTY